MPDRISTLVSLGLLLDESFQWTPAGRGPGYIHCCLAAELNITMAAGNAEGEDQVYTMMPLGFLSSNVPNRAMGPE